MGMNHHKTNTLRLEYLLSELRGLLDDMKAQADATLDRNQRSHIGHVLKAEADNFEVFLKETFKKMYGINWVEPEAPLDPTE